MTLDRVWLTVTLAVLVVLRPPASVIVTRKRYEPAMLNVTWLDFAAFLIAPPMAFRRCSFSISSPPSFSTVRRFTAAPSSDRSRTSG